MGEIYVIIASDALQKLSSPHFKCGCLGEVIVEYACIPGALQWPEGFLCVLFTGYDLHWAIVPSCQVTAFQQHWCRYFV